jgi:hypothetical protein
MLRAFFDESGTHAEAPVTAIAGFIGKESEWTAVEDLWRPLLADVQHLEVKTFHAAPAIAQEGEFGRVDKPTRNYLLTQISKALRGSGILALCSAVPQDDWNAVVTDPTFLARFPRPFDLCFDDIVRQMTKWSREYANRELVVPMFAYQHEYYPRMADIGKAYGAEDWYKRTLGPISFGYTEQTIPLQGADLLVHEMAIEIADQRNAPDLGTRELLTRTIGLETPLGHWFDRGALKNTLERFRETGEIYKV